MNSYPRSLNFWTAKVGGKLLNLEQKTGLFFAHLHKQLIISDVFDEVFYAAGVFRPFFGFGKRFAVIAGFWALIKKDMLYAFYRVFMPF